MKVTFLGQAGFFIELESNLSVMIDPYLSDSLHMLKGEKFRRLVPIRNDYREKQPDLLLLTHGHGDHFDLDSIEKMLDTPLRKEVMAPLSVCNKICSLFPSRHNVMVARNGVGHYCNDAFIHVVPAFHENGEEVGFLFQAEGKNLYFSGDTLYSDSICKALAGIPIDVAFLCINGMGNNMNAHDAMKLADELSPKLAVPIHWDMFKEFGADPLTFTPQVTHRVFSAFETLVV